MSKVFLILLCLSLTGCLEPEVHKTSVQDAQELVDTITYVKAQNGLCFGAVDTVRLSTGGNAAGAYLLVEVDCEKVGLK